MSQRADRIIVVVEEAIDRLTLPGISAEKITCVSNTISIEGSDWGELADHSGKEKIMGYAGGIQHLRGLQYVIQGPCPFLLRKTRISNCGSLAIRHHQRIEGKLPGALEHSVRFFGT